MKKFALGMVMALSVAGTCLAGDVKVTSTVDRMYWEKTNVSIEQLGKFIDEGKEPSGSDTLTSMLAVSWQDPKKESNYADQYGQVIRGFIVPEKSGKYTFFIASDDDSALFLSTDADPKNKKKIAFAKSWVSPRQFDKYPEQKSVAIELEAGKAYYIEARQREGGGGDHLSVAWLTPDAVADAKPVVIPGEVLSSFKAGDPTAAK